MNQLLANVLDAHGGMNRWNEYQRVDATIVTDGIFWLQGNAAGPDAPTHRNCRKILDASGSPKAPQVAVGSDKRPSSSRVSIRISDVKVR